MTKEEQKLREALSPSNHDAARRLYWDHLMANSKGSSYGPKFAFITLTLIFVGLPLLAWLLSFINR